ncbi:phosphoenolpyruvate--protein phosphotransferase [Lysobacter sp. TY2-98]|uniref:phosphoenolpyruvate--protein phosphotransferase n=1 Tax=Lysobacter sp. TY2-98 TaxID=2290922 RepID=UPI000E209180|nr:phosphoenolpyruvate--protein phosphotransferase [Lysobacter sp. TY2-98]AXK71387.1 phosphoenolpyruvate--protein phosphotransferase [Lysobacter sp. TY2-98]
MRQAMTGQGASRGAVLGRARVRLPHALQVAEQHIAPDVADAELARLHRAIGAVRDELHALRARLHGALAQEVGEFLDLHTLMLDDPELLHGLDELVRDRHYSADYALRLQRDRLAAVFEAMDDPYFRSRVEDIDQVIGRVHAALHRRDCELQGFAGEILVAESVAPAEMAQLQAQGVIGLVTTSGSPLGHTAILARSLHMPLVVDCSGAMDHINDGDALIVDGGTGLVVVEPDADDLRAHREREEGHVREKRALARLRREPTCTRDGVDIRLFANAESQEDVAEAHSLGAAGIGLYRTEFLFLQRNALPDEDEQFRAYRDVVMGMSGRPVTIRTLDVGADKTDRTGLTLRDEQNPALGLRGVRLSLARRGLFETQLRALLRASAYGRIRLLVPMVTSAEEVRLVRAELDRVAAQLRAEGAVLGEEVPLGVMIEVPAAALALPAFINDVDFLSVGTNDLVQYLLAVDRNHEGLGRLYTPLHPAVIRVLRDTIRLAQRHGRPIAVCGEMAAAPDYAPLLLALGLTDFSLHPGTMLEVRQRIRDCDYAHLQSRLPALLRARDRDAIERWLASAA